MACDKIGIGKRLAGGALDLAVVDHLPNLSISLITRVWEGVMPVVRRSFRRSVHPLTYLKIHRDERPI
jgi:hypothetical protein